MVVARVSAANIVPLSVAPNLEGEEKEELRASGLTDSLRCFKSRGQASLGNGD